MRSRRRVCCPVGSLHKFQSVILSEAKDLFSLHPKTKADSSLAALAQNDTSKGCCANFWDATLTVQSDSISITLVEN
jgi:hypothetical protein